MHAIIRILFECEHCGKCCKITRAYSQTDVDRIEAYTHEPRDLIEEKLDSQVCGYLINNLCSIHFAKPSVCVWWPGPGADCPGYQKLVAEVCKPGMMSKICNTPELAELYTRCVLNGDLTAAHEILKRLE